ncbi:MAG TPA: hypothetical protein VJH05_01620 [Candidatus Paceibacterota bacterium]
MKNLYKYTLVIGLTVVFSFGGSASVFAQETVASIDARIAEIQVEIQSLLKQIQALQSGVGSGGGNSATLGGGSTVSSEAVKFLGNDNVITTSNLNVRSSTSLSGNLLRVVPEGTRGVIVSGPIFANGYNWWQVNWSIGISGWSVENHLEKIVVKTPQITTQNTTQATVQTTPSLTPSGGISATPIICDSNGFCNIHVTWFTENTNNAIVNLIKDGINNNAIFIGASSPSSNCYKVLSSNNACVFYTTEPSKYDYSEVIFNLYDYNNEIEGALLSSVKVTKSGVFDIPIPSTPPVVTTTTISQATVNFSHDGKKLIAGQDTWTFDLSTHRAGDELSVIVSKNGKRDPTPVFLCKSFLTSCQKSGAPTLSDVGAWSEEILINGVPTGKTITFTVEAPPVVVAPPSPATPKVNLLVAPSSVADTISNPSKTISIKSGESVKLLWILSPSLWSYPCTWSGGKSGTVSTTASSVSAGPFTSSQNITLTCSLAGIPYSDTVTVNIVTTTTTSEAMVTFSHDGKTLIAGQDTWMFNLSNARAGDELSVIVSKDGKRDPTPVFLCKSFLTSCQKSGAPTLSDIGRWSEEILINGVPTGKTITFTVEAPPVVVAPPSPAVAGVSFSFSQNGGYITADKDSWTMNVTGLQGGDEVYVDAWKDGTALGKFKICIVPMVGSPIPVTSCEGNGKPTEADKGNWEEAVVIRRGGVDTVTHPRGAIKFTVAIIAQPTVTYSSQSCSISVSSNSITVGQSATWHVNSSPAGYPFVWKGYDGSTNIGSVSGGSTNYTLTYKYDSPATYTRYAEVSMPTGVCTTNTENFEVKSSTSFSPNSNFASAIYALMETLNSISKQLDLLK